MAKIISPNKKYNGVSASLRFVNGEAETDDKWLIGWFENKGYEVVGDSDSSNEDNNQKGKSVLDGNVEEVKEAVEGFDNETLQNLLQEEKDNKDRKGVIDHIESLIAEQGTKKEEGE